MKKTFLTLAIGLMSAVAVNAQVVVGGSLNFSANGGVETKMKTDAFTGVANKTPLDFSFGIAPQVGYIINEKWEIGASLALTYSDELSYAIAAKTGETPLKGKAYKDNRVMDFNWSINPYARFRCFEVKGFGIWIEGVASLGTTAATGTKFYAYADDNYTDYRTKEQADLLNKKDPNAPKTSNFQGGLFFQPILTYDINEHWILETKLNFLGFNLSGSVYKVTDKDGNWTSENTCNFGLNVTSENVAQVGQIAIGVKYKF